MMMIVPESCQEAVRNAWLELGSAPPPSRLAAALLSLPKTLPGWPAAMLEEGALQHLIFEGDSAMLLQLLNVLPPCQLRYLGMGQAQFQPQCWPSRAGVAIAPLVVGETCRCWRRSGTYVMWWTCIDGLAVRVQLWMPLSIEKGFGSSIADLNHDPFLADLHSPIYYWPVQVSLTELATTFSATPQ